MIEIKNKEIIIDGEPKMIMCGEIHYFRLKPEDWQDRIDKLKESGCNAVATYVPWICHEYVEGEIDLDGHIRPELDLISFIELCKENGLYFFLRPGPFIMAEIKNEGLPYWVYEKHPEIVPVCWDNSEATTKTIDYLAPGFLEEARKWYKAVMEAVHPYLYQNGGNIIAVQLDNEVGMLSWVSNCPDLTENLISDFSLWLDTQYSSDELSARYPFNLSDQEVRVAAIRSPKETYSAELMRDLGHYMRYRFAKYIAILRSYAEENGVRDIPFVVNIHGTGGGRGFTYPIGISQLYESYTQDSGYISGSDIYFGDLDMDTFQDLYIINGFMDAVHNPDQPLTSVEFNCGDGNFGETFGERMDPSAADFKARMCVAQGARLINYYLFSGGYNYRFDDEINDGNDRIAFTGERHGFAAPINPEGEYNYTFPRMARSIQTIMGVSEKLSVMTEEHDDVAFGFIPDYYMTEYRYPESQRMREIVQNLEANRAAGAWEIMGRAMLLSGYRFGSVDIQNKELNPNKTKVVALPSARYMDVKVQQKLVDYLNAGGRLLLYGEVPTFDMEGNPCTLLVDALGVTPTGVKRGEQFYFLSVCAENWVAPRPEVRTHFAQTFDIGNATPLFRVYGGNEICGFETGVGAGKAVVLGMAYRCDLELFRIILERLGANAGLTHDYPHHGLFMTSTKTVKNEKFIHILNLDGLDKELHVYENGSPLFEGRAIQIGAKDGVMLPINMEFAGGQVVYATAEIKKLGSSSIEFRLTQKEDVIVLKTDRTVRLSEDYVIEKSGDLTYITSKKLSKYDDHLLVLID